MGLERRAGGGASGGSEGESGERDTGRWRFMGGKGRRACATNVFVTENGMITGLNKGEDFYLALVMVDGEDRQVRYVKAPFVSPPDFNSTLVVYDLVKLWAKGSDPLNAYGTSAS